jgi:hypothetical protein
MRRTAAESNAAGHDSFLDIVSNIVGILVILVMVVGLRVKNAPVSPEQDKRLQMTKARLGQGQTTVMSLRNDVLELERQIQAVKSETSVQFKTRDELATLVTALEHEIQGSRSRLDARTQAEFDLRRRLSDAQAELWSLKAELSNAHAAQGSPKVVESYPTPLSQTVDDTELHFQLRRGRIAFIPLDRLIEKFKSEAQHKLYKLRDLPEVTDIVGPEGGFRFRYTLERRGSSLEEQLVTGHIRIQLRRWTLIPVSDALGEPTDAAIDRASRFRSVLAGYHPDKTAVTIWVYPDSFADFRRLKKALFEMGFATAARPLPDGFPISGSPEGTKSAAE